MVLLFYIPSDRYRNVLGIVSQIMMKYGIQVYSR